MNLIWPARPRHAFTLVEVLLAIGILTLVISGIYATWTAILRATKAGQTVALEVQRSRVALRSAPRRSSEAAGPESRRSVPGSPGWASSRRRA